MINKIQSRMRGLICGTGVLLVALLLGVSLVVLGCGPINLTRVASQDAETVQFVGIQAKGAVALANRIMEAEVVAKCGSTTSKRVRTGIKGTYNLDLSGQAAIDECRDNGIRVRADFTIDGRQHTLFSGRPVPADSSEDLTVNVTPISDVAIRQSTGLTDSGEDGWFNASPNTIDWDKINNNVEAIVTAMGIADNPDPITTIFDAAIANRITAYQLTTTDTEITLRVRDLGGGSNALPKTIEVRDGVIQVPVSNDPTLTTLQDAADKEIAVLEMTTSFDERIVDNEAPTTIAAGQACTANVTPCATGLVCRDNGGNMVCSVPLIAEDGACTADGTACATGLVCRDNACRAIGDGSNGSVCGSGSDCNSGLA